MVWNDRMIIEWAASGGVDPFNIDMVNPASIDLRWSGRFKMKNTFEQSGWGATKEREVLEVFPMQFFLLDTLEYITMPSTAAGLLLLKSSVGRTGLEHLHAGYFDPAFHGTATLEMLNVTQSPIKIRRGDRLVQLMLLSMIEVPDVEYPKVGRYAGQIGPQPALEPRKTLITE